MKIFMKVVKIFVRIGTPEPLMATDTGLGQKSDLCTLDLGQKAALSLPRPTRETVGLMRQSGLHPPRQGWQTF